mmetsp:Transcript_68361/g.198032  ORF Transcript_68361/g.198032 Transcript_68361/m.198032 type:complete len:283 (+) Transcript_68361:859-1707(+)
MGAPRECPTVEARGGKPHGAGLTVVEDGQCGATLHAHLSASMRRGPQLPQRRTCRPRETIGAHGGPRLKGSAAHLATHPAMAMLQHPLPTPALEAASMAAAAARQPNQLAPVSGVVGDRSDVRWRVVWRALSGINLDERRLEVLGESGIRKDACGDPDGARTPGRRHSHGDGRATESAEAAAHACSVGSQAKAARLHTGSQSAGPCSAVHGARPTNGRDQYRPRCAMCSPAMRAMAHLPWHFSRHGHRQAHCATTARARGADRLPDGRGGRRQRGGEGRRSA